MNIFSARKIKKVLFIVFQRIEQKMVPRVLLIDLESEISSKLPLFEEGKFRSILLIAENFITGSGGAGTNWAQGHYAGGYQVKGNK